MSGNKTVQAEVPERLLKLIQRLQHAPDGRYFLVITKEDGAVTDWSVMGGGKVEFPAPRGEG